MAVNGSHPTGAEIDAVRAGEGAAANILHLQTCASCRQTLAELERLAVDLRSPSRLPFEIPAEVDARILWNARKQAQAARKGGQPTLRRLGAARWAIAAAVVLALGAVGLWERVMVTPVQVASVASDDIDRNGKIDIRDAFLLAKAMDTRSDDALAEEIEGERFESSDIDRIARQAVAVGKQG
jgi:anti-sigma factor RsiW